MTKIWLRRFIVCIALTSLTVGAKAADNRLDVYWNDTEGGAATLIVTPAGESILIDTGNPGGRDAQRIFKTASEIAGLKQIDYLIVTHFHIDHFGGAAELSKLIPIRVVYDNGEFTGGRERPSKEYLAFPAERRVMNPGDVLPLKQLEGAPAISFKCIAARQKFVDPPCRCQAQSGLRTRSQETGRWIGQRQQHRRGSGLWRFPDVCRG